MDTSYLEVSIYKIYTQPLKVCFRGLHNTPNVNNRITWPIVRKVWWRKVGQLTYLRRFLLLYLIRKNRTYWVRIRRLECAKLWTGLISFSISFWYRLRTRPTCCEVKIGNNATANFKKKYLFHWEILETNNQFDLNLRQNMI